MASFSTSFLGCKVSFADQQAIRERLLCDGHVQVDADGDLAVVNTCCVTHEAVSKSRQAVSRAARSHRTVYVTGCAANLPDGAFAGLPDNVVVVPGRSEAAADAVAGDVGAIGCVNAEYGLDRVRAFVKIQDGCSFSCAFCVIPLVRGGTRSRTAAAVLAEIRRRAGQGHGEIVLTGVNLGCFRDREAGYTLARLVREAGAIEGVKRLRLSSIEINHVTDDLVAALRETPTVSRHLHVPLQSGDDAVLAAMGRRYRINDYLSKLALLRDFNLTSDVIVGFPGEDEAAFGRTLDAVAGAGVSLLATARHPHGRGRSGAGGGQAGTKHPAARSVRHRLPCPLAAACRERGPGAGRPSGAGLRRRLHAVARRCAGGRVRARPGNGCLRRRGGRGCRLSASSATWLPKATTCTQRTGSWRSATSRRRLRRTC
jgi:threonylcarbamoyladenosine tRNA methylthiotransferase MtaB